MTNELPQTFDLILSRQQVRNCDSVAIEKYGIPGIVLMENAGAAAARHIFSLLPNPEIARVCIVAGTGNNAGDGFVVARHLGNAGVSVEVLISGSREKIKGDARSNLEIIEKMDIPILYMTNRPASAAYAVRQHASHAKLIVDAMLGTGTSGPPREPIRSIIKSINQLKKTVVALDIPSGLDCDTGLALEVAVEADYTITFAAMKRGFLTPDAKQYTGKVTVASIGINTALLG